MTSRVLTGGRPVSAVYATRACSSSNTKSRAHAPARSRLRQPRHYRASERAGRVRVSTLVDRLRGTRGVLSSGSRWREPWVPAMAHWISNEWVNDFPGCARTGCVRDTAGVGEADAGDPAERLARDAPSTLVAVSWCRVSSA